jgi:hypothetical protein
MALADGLGATWASDPALVSHLPPAVTPSDLIPWLRDLTVALSDVNG